MLVILFPSSVRNNKLGLDEISVDGVLERLVEEIHILTPPASAPISALQVLGVSVGTSHTAIATGETAF